MAIDPSGLKDPIDLSDPQFARLLSNLQGNILKSHGRDYAAHIFFRFSGGQAVARKLVIELAKLVTSALAQAAQTAANKNTGSEELFGTLLLSAKGLRSLGFPIPAGFGDPTANPKTTPVPVSFSQSMIKAAQVLGDDPAIWDAAYADGDIDGLLIIAAGKEMAPFGPNAIPSALLDAMKAAEDLIAASAKVVALEIGQQQRRGVDAVEHFGYVDGISQPLMVASDLPPAADRTDFDQSAGPNLVLVKDPFVQDADACGSFFVFRKLEQNVAAFRAAEGKLAVDLGLADPALAEGLIVGRFRNGTPIILSATAAAGPAKENNFNYGSDPNPPMPGFPAKCPFHAHIRKTNPRGDISRQIVPGADAAERARRIARRAITYGERDTDLADAPSEGVGLLFQCYQQSIGDQFAFMQNGWANNVDFVRKAAVGQDPVIGQGTRGTKQTWPTSWGGGSAPMPLPDIGQFVLNRGGEFFFAPSIPFFASLNE